MAGYCHDRFPGVLGGSADLAGTAGKRQSLSGREVETGSESAAVEAQADNQQALGSTPTSVRRVSAHCPSCSHASHKWHGSAAKSNGKYRFICSNEKCEKGAKKGTFSAHPLA